MRVLTPGGCTDSAQTTAITLEGAGADMDDDVRLAVDCQPVKP